MTTLDVEASDDGLVVVVCLKFDHRSPVDERETFKTCLCNCENNLTALNTSGTFDLIAQFRVGSVDRYKGYLDQLAVPLSRFVERFESSFLCEPELSRQPSSKYDDCIWLPCAEGRRRVDVESITHISAERDYMRLHLRDGSECLMHITARRLMELLDPSAFMRIHRSTIVHRSFVERYLQEGRHWSARLKSGEVLPIAKSHLKEALSKLSRPA